MLPDLPSLKKDLADLLLAFLRLRAQKHLGPGLSDIPRSTIHEGNKHVIVRPDGQIEEVKIHTATAEFMIETSDLRNLSFPDILRRYDEIAQSMAEQQARHMFGAIDEAVTKAGNVVDGQGRKLSAELFYEILERIQIDFDSSGKPELPQMIVGAKMAESVAAVQQDLEANPGLVKKFNRLMELKKEEWRAREDDRSLVG